jgi:hypothetical protein
LPVEPLPFQPPKAWTPGHAPVVALAAKDVQDARLDLVEEALDLGRPFETPAETVDVLVREADRPPMTRPRGRP